MSNMESSANEMNHWMLVNHSKSNRDKTELLTMSVKHVLRQLLCDISVMKKKCGRAYVVHKTSGQSPMCFWKENCRVHVEMFVTVNYRCS